MEISKEYAAYICAEGNLSAILIRFREAYRVSSNELGEKRAKEVYEGCINRLLQDYIECCASKIISLSQYKALVGIVGAFLNKGDSAAQEIGVHNMSKNVSEIFDKDAAQEIEVHNMSKNVSEISDKDEEYSYKVGDLITPKDIDRLPVLATPQRPFVAPAVVDLRDYCLETQNQEDRPWCAAYAACGFASNILWRKYDVPKVYNPEDVYRYAKTIDGCPNSDGTTLVAALLALIHYNLFSRHHCSVKVLRTIRQMKYAIHKFGCCLIGLIVTKEWYLCNRNKSTISGKEGNKYESLGGHAVLACGYTREGVIIQNPWGVDWGSYGFALITWDELKAEFLHGAVIDNCLYDTKMN